MYISATQYEFLFSVHMLGLLHRGLWQGRAYHKLKVRMRGMARVTMRHKSQDETRPSRHFFLRYEWKVIPLLIDCRDQGSALSSALLCRIPCTFAHYTKSSHVVYLAAASQCHHQGLLPASKRFSLSTRNAVMQEKENLHRHRLAQDPPLTRCTISRTKRSNHGPLHMAR